MPGVIGMPKLYLVRHGEPESAGLLLGRHDPGLSTAGRLRARQALGGLRGAVIYCSPLRRATQTAEALPAGIPRRVLVSLSEIDFGAWNGLSWDQIEKRDPELSRRKQRHWFGIAPPGGETWQLVLERAAAALAEMRQGRFPAIAVAHLGIGSALAHLLAGVDPYSFQMEYCEIREYEIGID